MVVGGGLGQMVGGLTTVGLSLVKVLVGDGCVVVGDLGRGWQPTATSNCPRQHGTCESGGGGWPVVFHMGPTAVLQELESSLQVFINSSFENITSTINALRLLKKFQSILKRETLRADLESKYMVIFHNYGLDLENVQKMYERHKSAPPSLRNWPPISSNITWSQQVPCSQGCIRRGGASELAQKRLDRRLEEGTKAVGSGYCRLQMPFKLALAATETVAGA